ncbi:DUF6480 family protein [Streptomyces glomeratus]|uniref:Uncharacterized protein n=1 Tax=Streptomyces glomeratus TaxID=284452 RepID=A0ABP6L2Q4_9ACTN|nr:DUF6480 family protein [Streptomyces glomeratus]MCF1511684.1 DUF6480 family protein [Streptomyces glomeratus]
MRDRQYGGPEPEPAKTPRVEPGGVPPGETPPGEGSTSGASPNVVYDRTRGWGKGPLIAIMFLTVLVAGFFLAYALALIFR